MKKLIFFTLIIALITSCKDDDYSTFEVIQLNIEGHYTGIFERGNDTSNVELELINETFSGNSSVHNFPAICKGSYSIANDSISFENFCAFTADFDWTLILSYDWAYTLEDDTLLLTKDNGDKYTLIKQ